MQESLSIGVWKCPVGTSRARLCARAHSSGRRSRVDGPPDATGARLDRSRRDDFADFRFGWDGGTQSRALCFWWPSRLFSPWPAPQCPIFSRRLSRWWQWNVLQRGRPNRSGAKAWRPLSRWASQALRGRTSCFFCLSRRSFCWTAQSQGDSGTNPPEVMALVPGLRGLCFIAGNHCSLSVSIIWPSIPLPLPRGHSIYAQSSCLSAVLRFSSAAGRLLAGEPFEDRTARFVFILAAVAVVPCFFFGSAFANVSFLRGFGFDVLAGLLFEALKRRDHTGLFLMLWILIPLPIVYYAHLPMKYLLPCIPAVILLCFRLMEGISVPDCPSRCHCIDRCQHWLFPSHPSLGRRVCGVWPRCLVSIDSAARRGRRKSLVRRTVLVILVCAPGRGNAHFPGGPQPKPGDLLVVDEFAWEDGSAANALPASNIGGEVTHKYRFGRTMGAGMACTTIGSLAVGVWG